MERKKLCSLSVGLVAVLLFVGTVFIVSWGKDSAAAAPAKKLTIGVLMCMTGWFSGHDVKDANETHVVADIINEGGGITVKGEKYLVELTVEDGKSTLDGITAAANRLIFDKKVKFIIGPAAFFSAAAAPVADPAKVIHVAGFCTNQPGELDKNTPYAFLGQNGTVGEMIACFVFFKHNYPNVKRVAVVRPDDGALPYVLPLIKKALADQGLSLAGNPVQYPNEGVDFNSIASKLNAIKDADAYIHMGGVVPHFGAIIKSLRQMGNSKPYSACTASSLAEIQTVAGKDSMKDVFTVAITPGDSRNTPLMNEIAKRITSKYGANISIFLQGANSLWVLKQAMEAAQSLDPTVVKNKWETMDKVDTIYGPGRMCGDITYGIKHHAVAHGQPIQVIKDGKIMSAGLIDPGVIP